MKKIGVLFNEDGLAHLSTRFAKSTQEAARSRRGIEEVCRVLGQELGTEVVAIFSAKAGCSMCPCSPGFVLYASETTPAVAKAKRVEIWLRNGQVVKRQEGQR